MDIDPHKYSLETNRNIYVIPALLFTVFFLYIVIGQILSNTLLDVAVLTIDCAIGASAMMCWWIVFYSQYPRSRKIMDCSFVCAKILGCLGFLAGFVGPMIFAPGANQGPMLGIFITGPAGFFAGFVLGLLYGVIRY